MNKNTSTNEFQKIIVTNAMLEFVGLSLLVVGILVKNDMGFSGFALFKNENIVSLMIVFGGVLVLWANYKIISHIMERSKQNTSSE